MSEKKLPQFIMFAREDDEESLQRIEFIKEVMTSAATHMGHKIKIEHTSVKDYIDEIKKQTSATEKQQNE